IEDRGSRKIGSILDPLSSTWFKSHHPANRYPGKTAGGRCHQGIQPRDEIMDSIRKASAKEVAADVECCRCDGAVGPWDRIVGKPYCPNCQEALALGEAAPLIERAEKRRCTICNCVGTVRYATFPLHLGDAVEMDLCPEHLRGLL